MFITIWKEVKIMKELVFSKGCFIFTVSILVLTIISALASK